jgi:hypothetical protein
MPVLTRRRSPDAREECWHVYYGDVHVGTIAIRTGIPHDEDPWGWDCGFYPGSHPGESRSPALSTILWRNYAARDLAFPDRATLAFLTGLIVADTESMCGVAAVSLEPSSDVVRISR